MSGRGWFRSWHRRTQALGWCEWSSKFPGEKNPESHQANSSSLQNNCTNWLTLTSAFIPFMEYPQGLNIVASITEPGIRSRIPLICGRKKITYIPFHFDSFSNTKSLFRESFTFRNYPHTQTCTTPQGIRLARNKFFILKEQQLDIMPLSVISGILLLQRHDGKESVGIWCDALYVLQSVLYTMECDRHLLYLL